MQIHVKRTTRIMDLLASLRSWKLKSWNTFSVHFFVLFRFFWVNSGRMYCMYLSESICFTLEVRPTLEHVGRRRRGERHSERRAFRADRLKLSALSTRWRRTLCLHESAQGNGSLKLTPNTASPNAMNLQVTEIYVIRTGRKAEFCEFCQGSWSDSELYRLT